MVGRSAGLHNRGQEALSTGNSTSDIAIGSDTRLVVVGLSAVVRAVLDSPENVVPRDSMSALSQQFDRKEK